MSKNIKRKHTLRPIQLNVFYLPEAYRTADFEDKLPNSPPLLVAFKNLWLQDQTIHFSGQEFLEIEI